MIYAMAMPGIFYRSSDGFRDFETGPTLFNPRMRHAALLKRGNVLRVFWTQVGDAPERILLSHIDLSGDWSGWKESERGRGAAAGIAVGRRRRALVPSVRSTAYGHVNQLRDPAILEDEGRIYLFYAVAGESGIALAEVLIDV